MHIFSHIFSSLRETFPARASEWALATMLFGWAVVLSSNPDLFSETRSFAGLAQFADQKVWAWMCLFAGGGRLMFLAINGAWRRTPHLRALTALITCFFWFQITAGLLWAESSSTGLAIYPVLFFLDAFNVIRAMGDAGSADRIHRQQEQALNGSDQ